METEASASFRALRNRVAEEMALQRHWPAHHALDQEQLQGSPQGEPLQRQRLWQRAAKEADLQRYQPTNRRLQLPAKEMALQRR